ncbi:PAS domain-containing protein [Paenibacillus segetis]|uniref:PAS fold-4 domain-containing protein n=1 Tax=Paenibacillus segetis TaxID=1325360 RepID=A0ABQ1Y560_9BACL|nr:PAS domain-containing protein [Paenibacillus segetis]GGH13162.1 hypothetical protein GCM10008013_06040 [Paenibacillus segetis]
MTELSYVWLDAIHSLKLSICIISPDGTLEHVNQAWATQAIKYGLAPHWDRPGTNLLQLLGSSTYKLSPLSSHLLEHFHQILHGDSPYFQTEFQMNSTQETRWFLAEITPLTKQGTTQIEGILFTCSDITEFKEIEFQLIEVMSNISALHGLLPICAVCKKIKDHENVWNPLEKYMKQHTSIEFTHDICPECIRLLYPKYSSALDQPDQ